MSDLNIRKVDPDLINRVKARAAMEGKTLRKVVINLLEEYGTPIKALQKPGQRTGDG